MTARPRPVRSPHAPLDDLLRAVSGLRALGATAGVSVAGVTLDSRAVQAGDLYAALPGANVHGARFVADAVAAGAVAVLTDPDGRDRVGHGRGKPVPFLLAEDPRAVLGAVSAYVYGEPAKALTMVGVTGTNGKTTTVHLLEAALRTLGRATGLIGTIETRIGLDAVPSVRTTPESCDLHALLAMMRERDATVCCMEVSSHALALHRVDGVHFDVAVFTNLSQDHLDFHGTMEEYFATKATLFTRERSRAGVVGVDDDWGVRLAGLVEVPVRTVSNRADRDADWRIEPGEADRFTLRGRAASLELRAPLPGAHNRTNTAFAAAALDLLGFAPDDIERAFAEEVAAGTVVPGRMQAVDLGAGAPAAYVDFAHTPDAVAATLGALREGASGRLVAVLGAGGARDPGKRPGMGAAAARLADDVVVTDDNPRHEDPATIRAAVLEGVAAGPGRGHDVAGRAAGIALGLELAGSDGVVAVLGKGHENGQTIGSTTRPFDDAQALRSAWRARPAVPSDRTEA